MNNTLLPPSASAWMRGAEAATAKLSGITVAIRTLWTPTACPVDLLPYLAWALSVDRWDKNWPAEKKIASIQQSYWLHRRKGTRAAVRRVIEDMGFTATFAEWFETGDEPGTFRLEVGVNETGLTDKTLNELNRLIDDARPVSRHISMMSVSNMVTGIVHVGMVAFYGDIVTVYPQDYEPNSAIKYDGKVDFSGNYKYAGSEK
ncbi:phage tail protein I [Klebsiella aerogenes]|nr:phage tail protein I [Klebsiella aerogenes]